MNDNLLTPNTDPVQPDPTKNYLTELVGDGKKFKSPEELARGKFEADQYVKHMERQLDEMRSDYTKLRDDYQARAKLEEIIDQMKITPQQQPTQQIPQAPVVPQQQPQIDPKTIESLVSSKIMEHEASKAQQANFDLVKSKLQERFGSNYQTVLKEQVEQLGLTEDFVNDLARKHPSVLLKTLGVDGQSRQNFQAPIKSEQRSDTFSPNTQNRTWAYYQNLKRADPTVYYQPQTQVQLHHDAIALGDAFKDGDYNAM